MDIKPIAKPSVLKTQAESTKEAAGQERHIAGRQIGQYRMISFDGDIAVVGTGSVGSMALWRLARRGIKATGFEQFSPGHDRSAAGGETRVFRTAYLEDPRYVPLAETSLRLWRDLEAEVDRQLLILNGGLMIGNPDSLGLRNVMKSIADYDLEHEVLDTEDVARRYPQHSLLPGEQAILDKQAGFLPP